MNDVTFGARMISVRGAWIGLALAASVLPGAAQAPSPAAPSAPVFSATGVPTGAGFLTDQGSAQVLVTRLMGLPVFNRNNDRVGDVRDLLADDDGSIRALLVGVGGFLGIGEKTLAIDVRTARFEREGGRLSRVIIDAPTETLNAAPAFRLSGPR